MSQLTITQDDLAPVLAIHSGNATFRAVLLSALAPERLTRILAQYIQFNSAFGPGVANLAGEIAARQGLFRDPDEPLVIASDRAAHVASDFFYAAVDEFDDRATPWRDTHRTLAQATLKGVGVHFGYATDRLNEIAAVKGATEAAMAEVWEGYGIGARLEEERLFAAMGFHTGSEILADQEFVILDRHLREKHPDLVRSLEPMTVEILGERHNAYYWVRIHTGVEAEHFDAALKGVNAALRFYSGAVELGTAKDWILQGFSSFADVQQEFMASLAEA